MSRIVVCRFSRCDPLMSGAIHLSRLLPHSTFTDTSVRQLCVLSRIAHFRRQRFCLHSISTSVPKCISTVERPEDITIGFDRQTWDTDITARIQQTTNADHDDVDRTKPNNTCYRMDDQLVTTGGAAEVEPGDERTFDKANVQDRLVWFVTAKRGWSIVCSS